MRAELDWEGLVIDNVPMEDVEFRERHGLDDALDGSSAQEVSGGVDHDASVLEQWLILDDGVRDLVVLDDLRKRLQGIDISGVVSVLDLDSSCVDIDLVRLSRHVEAWNCGEQRVDVLFEGQRARAFGVAVDPLEHLAQVVLGVNVVHIGGTLEEVTDVGELEVLGLVGFVHGWRENQAVYGDEKDGDTPELEAHVKINNLQEVEAQYINKG